MGLKIEPENKVVLEELKKLPPKESKPGGLPSKYTPKTETKPESPKKPSVSISKPYAEEQKEKDQKKGVERRRLAIKVVDEAYSDSTTATTTTTTTTAAAAAPAPAPAIDNKVTTATPPSLPSTAPSFKMDTNTKAGTVNEQSKKKNIGIQEINNDDDKPVPTLVNPTDITPKLPPIKFNVPKTNLEFERDWKTCRHRGTDVLYQYFQVRKK